MDTPPPPPPPSPPTTIPLRAHGFEIDPPTNVLPNRMGNQLNPPLANDVLNHHRTTTPLVVGYGKCRRNHAIGTGGHSLDGCGEFIPTPISTPIDLTFQKCIACGCHRSFHRCDADHFHQPVQYIIEYQPIPPTHPQSHHQHHSSSPSSRFAVMEKSSDSPDSLSPPPISSSYYPAPPHMFLALNPSLAPLEPTNNNYPSIFATTTTTVATATASGSNQNGKKRFRSKFSQHQKEKMQELAERIGWKMQKKKEDMIDGVCSEIGVTRDVFKVWMHNHKNINSNNKGSNNHGDSGNATTTNGSSFS